MDENVSDSPTTNIHMILTFHKSYYGHICINTFLKNICNSLSAHYMIYLSCSVSRLKHSIWHYCQYNKNTIKYNKIDGQFGVIVKISKKDNKT